MRLDFLYWGGPYAATAIPLLEKIFKPAEGDHGADGRAEG